MPLCMYCLQLIDLIVLKALQYGLVYVMLTTHSPYSSESITIWPCVCNAYNSQHCSLRTHHYHLHTSCLHCLIKTFVNVKSCFLLSKTSLVNCMLVLTIRSEERQLLSKRLKTVVLFVHIRPWFGTTRKRISLTYF